jgi:hypothetical protein
VTIARVVVQPVLVDRPDHGRIGDAGETAVRPPRAGEQSPRVLGVVGDPVVEFDEASVQRAERVLQVFVVDVVDHAPDTTRIQRPGFIAISAVERSLSAWYALARWNCGVDLPQSTQREPCLTV